MQSRLHVTACPIMLISEHTLKNQNLLENRALLIATKLEELRTDRAHCCDAHSPPTHMAETDCRLSPHVRHVLLIV